MYQLSLYELSTCQVRFIGYFAVFVVREIALVLVTNMAVKYLLVSFQLTCSCFLLLPSFAT